MDFKFFKVQLPETENILRDNVPKYDYKYHGLYDITSESLHKVINEIIKTYQNTKGVTTNNTISVPIFINEDKCLYIAIFDNYDIIESQYKVNKNRNGILLESSKTFKVSELLKNRSENEANEIKRLNEILSSVYDKKIDLIAVEKDEYTYIKKAISTEESDSSTDFYFIKNLLCIKTFNSNDSYQIPFNNIHFKISLLKMYYNIIASTIEGNAFLCIYDIDKDKYKLDIENSEYVKNVCPEVLEEFKRIESYNELTKSNNESVVKNINVSYLQNDTFIYSTGIMYEFISKLYDNNRILSKNVIEINLENGYLRNFVTNILSCNLDFLELDFAREGFAEFIKLLKYHAAVFKLDENYIVENSRPSGLMSFGKEYQILNSIKSMINRLIRNPINNSPSVCIIESECSKKAICLGLLGNGDYSRMINLTPISEKENLDEVESTLFAQKMYGTHLDAYSTDCGDNIYYNACVNSKDEIFEYIKTEFSFNRKMTVQKIKDIIKFNIQKNLNKLTFCNSENPYKEFIQDNKQVVTEFDAFSLLENYVGLDGIKNSVMRILSYFSINKMKLSAGLMMDEPLNMHMVFKGNPGTAKTTIARIVAQVLHKEGILVKDKIVEVGRSDLIAEYVGHTAIKTKAIIEKARGGVLFIDEAYSISAKGECVFGQECINTLVEQMELVRENTVIIFAGYPKEMDGFIASNPGIKSRIGFELTFDNYTKEQLLEIAKIMANKCNVYLSDETTDAIGAVINENINRPDFGNGRFVRSVLEKAVMEQSYRLIQAKNNGEELDLMKFKELKPEDIVYDSGNTDKKPKMGFKY